MTCGVRIVLAGDAAARQGTAVRADEAGPAGGAASVPGRANPQASSSAPTAPSSSDGSSSAPSASDTPSSADTSSSRPLTCAHAARMGPAYRPGRWKPLVPSSRGREGVTLPTAPDALDRRHDPHGPTSG